MSLKCPFCPDFCPNGHSNKRFYKVKCVFETVLFAPTSGTINVVKHVCRDCPIPHCGAKYLVKLSNHLTDVHRLDYIQRRKWLQEAKLQPKIRVVIYPAKASQEFRMRSKSKTTPLKQQTGNDIVLYQISTPRKVKKLLKSLTRGIEKAAKNIQRYSRAADLVPEWLTL